MRILLLFLLFILSNQTFAQIMPSRVSYYQRLDTVIMHQKMGKYHVVKLNWEKDTLLVGLFKEYTYKHDEYRTIGSSSPMSYRTGRRVQSTSLVPAGDVKLWHLNGRLKSEYRHEGRFLKEFDTSGTIQNIYYFSKTWDLDSSLNFYPNGKVKTRQWGASMSEYPGIYFTQGWNYSQLIIRNRSLKNKKEYHESGVLESSWTSVPNTQRYMYHLDNVRFEYNVVFYNKDGSVRKDIVRTNDGYLTGNLITYYPNGQIKSKDWLYRGQPDGSYKTWYENGQLKSIGRHKGRAEDSIAVTWYENGQMWSWQDGDVYFEWHDNGAIKVEKCGQFGLKMTCNRDLEILGSSGFSNYLPEGVPTVSHFGERDSLNLRHGRWEGRFEDGTLAYEAHFNHGFQVGAFKLYLMDGQLSQLLIFENGVQQGPAKYFDRYTGGLIYEGSYHNGRKSGVWNYYNSQNGYHYKSVAYVDYIGEVKLFQYLEKDSTLLEESNIDSITGRVEMISYRNGFIRSKKIRSVNSQYNFEAHYDIRGNIERSEEVFDASRARKITYKRPVKNYDEWGNITGEHLEDVYTVPRESIYYYSNGNLKSHHFSGVKNKNDFSINYYEDGTVKSEEHFRDSPAEDFSSKKKYYDKEGKLIKIEHYNDGKLMRTSWKIKSDY